MALASAESNAAPKRQRSPEQPDPQGNAQKIQCNCIELSQIEQ
ncbi:MAG TPA: hypothetical protein PKH93_10455 [Chitinophagales bacterium]|nr:hypothetical protein [Chitinophagales bacterium]